MNKTYLIGYDLNKEGSSAGYINLIHAIKELGGWAKPLESTFFVTSSHSSSTIRDHLKQFVDSNDELLVIQVTSNWATYGLDERVTTWMNNNI